MNEPIIVEQLLHSSTIEVWEAITQKNQMIQWFFDNIPDFRPDLGFKTEFIVKSTDRRFTHLWEIIEIIPYTKIAYSWQYKEYQGESVAIFELFQRDNKTLLRVTCEGLESFPQDIPEFSRESCQGGWAYFLNRLHLYLNK